ncbi:hypothetical protein Hanom_Chr05g00417111 [Helianthus anomalus]
MRERVAEKRDRSRVVTAAGGANVYGGATVVGVNDSGSGEASRRRSVHRSDHVSDDDLIFFCLFVCLFRDILWSRGSGFGSCFTHGFGIRVLFMFSQLRMRVRYGRLGKLSQLSQHCRFELTQLGTSQHRSIRVNSVWVWLNQSDSQRMGSVQVSVRSTGQQLSQTTRFGLTRSNRVHSVFGSAVQVNSLVQASQSGQIMKWFGSTRSDRVNSVKLGQLSGSTRSTRVTRSTQHFDTRNGKGLTTKVILLFLYSFNITCETCSN